MGALFSKAKRNHADRFQQSGKAINDKVRLYSRIGRALMEVKQPGGDPFAAIKAIIPWDVFTVKHIRIHWDTLGPRRDVLPAARGAVPGVAS